MHEKEFTKLYFNLSIGPLELLPQSAQRAFGKSVDQAAQQDLARQFSRTHEKATEVDQLKTKSVGFFSKIKLNNHQYSIKKSFKIMIIHVLYA